jgi:hypothetical protein
VSVGSTGLVRSTDGARPGIDGRTSLRHVLSCRWTFSGQLAGHDGGLLAGDIEARCGHLATVPGYPVVMVVDNLLGLGFATG